MQYCQRSIPHRNTHPYDIARLLRRRVPSWGISLIEVLMSIGVIAIGLLGVAALIPVAGYQAQEGARNDRTAHLGKRVFREIKLRGLLHPSRWSHFHVDHYSWPGGPPFPSFPRWGPAPCWERAHGTDRIPTALLLDPWGYTAGLSTLYPPQSDQELLRRSIVFRKFWSPPRGPGLGQAPRLYRIGLDGPASNDPFVLSNYQQYVDELCFIQDDLKFDIPKQNAQLPLQVLLKEGGQPVKRHAQGQFSWMATIVPAESRPVSPVGWQFSQPYRGPYRVSVAILQERTRFQHPVVMQARAIDGWGGGTLDIQRGSIEQMQPTGQMARVPFPAELKSGQWVLLVGGSLQAQGGYVATEYRWYRVAALDPPAPPTMKVGSLVLSGGDWPIRKWAPPATQQTFDPAGQGVETIFVLYFGNVVGVYTKTMYLD